MNVLSCFDGISCGRLALENLGIVPDIYYASEVDKHAITISKKSYKDIILIIKIYKYEKNYFTNNNLINCFYAVNKSSS